MNKEIYGGVLSADERVDLYNTIIHENWHSNQQSVLQRANPWLDGKTEAEAYAEANRRSALAANEIKRNSPKCGCGN